MTTGLILVLVFFILVALNVPIGFAIGLSTLAALVAIMPFDPATTTMAQRMVAGLDSFTLLAIPFFILSGYLMGAGGVARRLIDAAKGLIGALPGGLAVVSIISSMLFGSVSGSAVAATSAIGSFMVPAMKKEGYDAPFAASVTTSASILGLLIPPSVTMIVYGWVTDTSILACFLATLGPGLLIMTSFSVINLFMSRKFNLVLDDKPSFSELSGEVARRGFHAFPALLMPVIILGGIYGGVMTPTEAAAVAVIYAVPVGFLIYKGLRWSNFLSAGKEAATAVGAIMMMILFSMILSQMFVYESIPQQLVQGIFSITENKVVLLIMINIMLFLVGMVVNDVTAIILIAPLLLPLMQAIGVSPVQFAAIMGVNTAMGGVTPPYASILYLGARIGNVKVTKVIPPAMKLILFGYVPVVFLTSLWPDLSLFLPRFFGYDVAP